MDSKKYSHRLEMENERSLGRVAYLAKKASKGDIKCDTFGVIIDCTSPYENKNNEHYVKVKIIDQTFNAERQHENKNLSLHKYVTVTIKVEANENQQYNRLFGHILRLRRFFFKINEKGELCGSMVAAISNWLVVTNDTLQPKILLKSSRESNKDRVLFDFEKDTIIKMSDWSRKFLGRLSVRQILWWTSVNEPNSNEFAIKNRQSQEQVDLVLQVQSVDRRGDRVSLRDEARRDYSLNLAHPLFVPGETVIKLKNVSLDWASEARNIRLNDASTSMILPLWVVDAKVFGQDAESRTDLDPLKFHSTQKAEKFEKRKQVIELHPFLDDYYFEEHLLGKSVLRAAPVLKNFLCPNARTLIKKEYFHKAPTPISYLLNLKPTDKLKRMYQKFVVEIEFIGGVKTELLGLHSFCSLCKKVKPFVHNMSVDCCKKPVKVIFTIPFSIKDESSPRPINAFIVIRSSRFNPFVMWNILPSAKDPEGWKAFIKDDGLKAFSSKLELLGKVIDPIKLVIEMKETQKHILFFEVTDSVFLP